MTSSARASTAAGTVSPNEARAFYHGILGLDEKVKPPTTRRAGWLVVRKWRFASPSRRREEFHSGAKHPAFIVDELAAMVTKATQASYKVMADEPIEGCDRRHIDDPFGIRIELIEPHAK